MVPCRLRSRCLVVKPLDQSPASRQLSSAGFQGYCLIVHGLSGRASGSPRFPEAPRRAELGKRGGGGGVRGSLALAALFLYPCGVLPL